MADKKKSGAGSSRTTSKKGSTRRSSSSGARQLTATVHRQPAKKAAAPQRTKPVRQREKLPPDRVDEIVGVILIAVGVILGILTYGSTNAMLKTVVEFLFGLFGFIQYAMPIVLIAIGIVLIAVPRRQAGTGTIAMCLGVICCISCVIHLSAKDVGPMTFNEYITDGFVSGKSGQGGGFLAAIPAYALEKLLSVGGAIVVFVALALVMLLLITKVSIRTAGKKVIARVDAIEDRRKARFINETVGDDYPAPRRRRQTAAAAAAAPELVLGGDKGSETLSETFTTRRRRRLKAEEKDLDTVIREAEPAARTDPQLDVLPTSGKLPRDGSMFGELKAPPVVPADVYQPPEVPDYDPFETIEIVPEDNITGEKPGVDESAPAVEEKPADKPEVKAEAADLTEPPAVVYQKPPLSLLKKPDHSEVIANDSPSEKAKLLIETLASFNINARVMNISVGPVITRFEIQPAQGVRVNRITSLHNDLALALAAPRVRIEAPIPGKAAIGIEIPNKDTAMVRLREVIDTREFSAASSPLTFGLGKDIAGKPVYADLEKMPHMLIAGATGSGKSVCINSIILSTVYKSSPDEVRMILIDPKVVELSIFAPVPHLYCPIVTDPKKAAGVLKWACNEMDQRYSKMSKVNARDLARYNSIVKDPADRMPRLMIIIDELADLMIVSAKDVEESIARIAQLGRAAGIHLIVATQRPSVDVITGLIKANIPSRIAFAVSSAIDSRVILDAGGAEKLLGHGDMLFHPNGAAKPTRAQGAYVSDEEVENIMQFFVDNRIEIPQDNNVLDSIPDLTASTGQGNGKQEDELLPDAVRIVMDSGSASISMIQRRLRVGYARAARLVDIMEQMKLVSGFDGSKPRKVLIDEAGYQELFGSGSD